MPKQNRAYKRKVPHLNPAHYLVIICEGAVVEKEYFEFFQRVPQRTRFKILPPENNASAPNHSLKRAQKYAKEVDLRSSDSLWIVSDVDRWEERTLGKINKECRRNGWNLAISNPCFEVWLLMHFKAVTDIQARGGSCKPFKQALSSHSGGYQVATFAPRIKEAIQRAKASDSDPNHFMPKLPGTKLYQLAEQMLEYMGQEWEQAKREWEKQ